MADVLIYGDTIRSPEARHEVPVAIPDPVLYAEHEGERHVVASSFELERIDRLGTDLVAHPLEEFGWDELVVSGRKPHEIDVELAARACKAFGVASAVTPLTFPLGVAERLRADGIDVRTDPELFTERRRAKNEHELAGIRRAQRAAEAGMRAAVEIFRRTERSNGALRFDGDELTCERVKLAIEQAFSEHGATAEEFIVAHGAQSAVGHDMGSGPIGPGEPVVIDLFPRDRESACFADMTRTFVLGDASDELLEYHRLAREALERVLPEIKPGITGRELHRLVCEFFHDHGHPTQLSKQPGEVLRDGFFHSLGHGVGLEVHEEPGLGRSGIQPLVAGDVVAVEPGLYRAGYGGARVEDLVLITDDGCENLTSFPYELEP